MGGEQDLDRYERLTEHASLHIEKMWSYHKWYLYFLLVLVGGIAALFYFLFGKSFTEMRDTTFERVRLDVQKDVDERVERAFEKEEIARLIRETAKLKVEEVVREEVAERMDPMFHVILLTADAREEASREAYDELGAYANGDYTADVARLAALGRKGVESTYSSVGGFSPPELPEGYNEQSAIEEILPLLEHEDSVYRAAALWALASRDDASLVPVIVLHLRAEL